MRPRSPHRPPSTLGDGLWSSEGAPSRRGRRARTAAAAAGVAVVVATGTLVTTHVASAAIADDVPAAVNGLGNPIVVSLGDSYISGEAGRWAGNSLNGLYSGASDTGADAYDDTGSGESIPGCHRSKAAEIHIDALGTDVTSVNLACSGATASTAWETSSNHFKPGIDFYRYVVSGQVYRGQALELWRLARANSGRIRMVVLSIGGNDFQFGPTVKDCLLGYLSNWGKCSDWAGVRERFSDRVAAIRLQQIKQAIANIDRAMREGDPTNTSWQLVVQDYPSPIPASNLRYAENEGRQTFGGCGLFDQDVYWANERALGIINKTVFDAARDFADDYGRSNVHLLDLSAAFEGRRLCEQGVTLVGRSSPFTWYDVHSWTDTGAADHSEWVSQIRLESMLTAPYQLQESLHPNYWGEKAYQVCLNQVWNGGTVRSGSCVRTTSGHVDGHDNPNMTLVSGDLPTLVTPHINAHPEQYVYATPERPDPSPTTTVSVPYPVPAGTVTVTASAEPAPTVTMPGPAETVTVSPVPGAVTALRATAGTCTGCATVSWRPPTTGWLTGYEYRARRDAAWTPWSSTRLTTVPLRNLPRHATTLVEVRAVNLLGAGPSTQTSVRTR